MDITVVFGTIAVIQGPALGSMVSAIVAILERHGGTIVERGRSSVVAVFGLDSDNAEHAANGVNAAREITRYLQRFSDEPIVRITLATGEMKVEALGRELMVAGDPLTLAYALHHLDSREILLSQGTRDEVGLQFPLSPIETGQPAKSRANSDGVQARNAGTG